jgi:hypothetical protein
MDTKKYNGWANYATWRVGLEMFDGYNAEDLDPHNKRVTSETCKHYVDQYLEDMTHAFSMNKYNQNASNIIGGWANAFLEDVNWQEIADHMNQEYAMC